MKKYKISTTRCIRCGGLVSWDDYPNPRWPIHIDQNGNKIGDGSCTNFTLQGHSDALSVHRWKNKQIPSNKMIGLVASAVVISVIAIIASVGMIMTIAPYSDTSQDKGNGDNDDDDEYTDEYQGPGWEIDAQGTAIYIVDGDTYDTDSQGRIRLADIDCPEQGESGYDTAKNYLNSSIYNKEVFLDIDDKYGTDVYDRIVAVTYVRYNSTHLLNVNKDLLEQGLATLWDFDNEFNPSTWSLYVYYV